MVFQCKCGVAVGTPDILIEHYRLVHSTDAVINNFYCMQSVACRNVGFDSLYKLHTHLTKRHINDLHLDPLNLGENAELAQDLDDPDPMEPPIEAPVEPEPVVEFDTFAQAVHDAGVMFIAKLYNKDTVPRCVVQDVVLYCQEFLGGFTVMLRKKVLHALMDANGDRDLAFDIREIRAMFRLLENPFSELETESKRITALKDAGAYLEPQAYLIGSQLKPVQERGVMHMQMVPSYGQHVQMGLTLKAFLEIPGVFDRIMENYDNLRLDNEIVSNFVQGQLWEKIVEPYNAEGKIVLPLFSFDDDYEPNDGLGSHSVDDKICGSYFKIPCIPCEFLSALRFIFVAALHYVKDRKDYGNRAVFEIVLNELDALANNGIMIDLPNRSVRVYFALCLILGDNLGVNGVLGFVESFAANFYCRCCKTHRDDARFQILDNQESLRNRENYEADLALADPNVTGIKEDCIFNGLPSYHATENRSGDLLHDVEEGICGYALPRVLYWLIFVRRYFSHKVFCQRVSLFNYGPTESGNKPPITKLTEDRIVSGTKFLLSGSESLCLVRYLSEMVGDLVPEDDQIWEYYLCLKKIVLFLYAPMFRRGSENILRVLVQEHHERYIEVFNEHLKPVHHFVTHLWRYMLLIGPLVHTSGKRFEAKHREATLAAASVQSRVNILKTIMIKNSLKFSYHMLSKKGLEPQITSSSSSEVLVSDLDFHHQFAELLNIGYEDIISVFKFINYHGTFFRVDTVCVFHLNEYEPVFGQIVHIVIHENSPVTFILKQLDVEYFDEHFYAFKVIHTDRIVCCQPSQLSSHQALWLRSGGMDGSDLFVSLRYTV
ncbi:hypothetical protein FOCC_FOCC003790 [Frankliniella occidentalis]|nr:hypothetical protein FOCC_FOCC003790 [Frankliniella occidentalis]